MLIWILLVLWPSQCFIFVSVAQECSSWAPEYFRNLLIHAVNCSDTYISAAWPVALNLVLYSELCHFLLNSSQFFLCNFIFAIAICVLPPLQLVSHHPMKCTFLCGGCFRFCFLYLHYPLPALHRLLKPWSSFELQIEHYLLYKAFHNITVYAFLCISVVCLPIRSVSLVAQSCLTLRPHGLQHARLPCPSPTPRVHPNSCPSSRWCHPTISSSVIPFPSCLQSFLASESFQMSPLFSSGGQSTGVSASTSVLPVNTQDWSPLGWTG